jgi:hypothetical protein
MPGFSTPFVAPGLPQASPFPSTPFFQAQPAVGNALVPLGDAVRRQTRRRPLR